MLKKTTTTTRAHTGRAVEVREHACSTCEAIAALLHEAAKGNPATRVPRKALRIEARSDKETAKKTTR